MGRVSVRTLMGLVAFVAISLAALRFADELWVTMLPLLVGAGIGTSLMGAFILRGRDRCWCAGFAFFAISYFTFACVASDEKNLLYLGTTQFLSEIATVSRGEMIQFQRVGHSLFTFLAGLSGGMIASRLYARRGA